MSTRMHRFSVGFALVFSLIATSLTLEAHTAEGNAESSWAALTGNMEKMHLAMNSIKPAGNNDVDFVDLMLPHHQAAIDMAKSELVNGKDPQMRRLAQEIITDQQSEIQLMHLWLKQHPPH